MFLDWTAHSDVQLPHVALYKMAAVSPSVQLQQYKCHHRSVMRMTDFDFKQSWSAGRTSIFRRNVERNTKISSCSDSETRTIWFSRHRTLDPHTQVGCPCGENPSNRRAEPVSVCVNWVWLEPGGVDAGDGVELGDAALVGRVKALWLAAHLEEHFLFLQLPGELVLQRLKEKQTKHEASSGLWGHQTRPIIRFCSAQTGVLFVCFTGLLIKRLFQVSNRRVSLGLLDSPLVPWTTSWVKTNGSLSSTGSSQLSFLALFWCRVL